VGLVYDPRGLRGVTTARPRVAGVLQRWGGRVFTGDGWRRWGREKGSGATAFRGGSGASVAECSTPCYDSPNLSLITIIKGLVMHYTTGLIHSESS
jgi:hypothetical protein